MKILITETWNPAEYAKRHPRVRARDLSPFLSLSFSVRARALLGSVPAIIPGSRDYAQLPRGTFSRTTPAAATVELAPIWPPPVLSPALGSNARAKARSPTLGNTLDRAESRLSARLPRIMDATVTHVNEACHLHLLRLRRSFSPRIRSTLG